MALTKKMKLADLSCIRCGVSLRDVSHVCGVFTIAPGGEVEFDEDKGEGPLCGPCMDTPTSQMGGAIKAEKLREAAKLVREVLMSLNTKKIECPTCHLHKADDYDEALKARELGAVIAKLDRFAADFGRRRPA